MPDWYFDITGMLRDLRKKAWDAKAALARGDAAAAKLANDYMKEDYKKFYELWQELDFPLPELGSLARHIRFGDPQDYEDMLKFDIDFIAENAEKHLRDLHSARAEVAFDNLLDPVVRAAALHHYQNGHYRDAVLNAVIALFDLIRARTGLRHDGANLATEAFALERARLIFSELDTESGKNDQKGFLEMIKGAYIGIRNPKAHSLEHDLDEHKAAQYLIFISLLTRRVAEAILVQPDGNTAP